MDPAELRRDDEYLRRLARHLTGDDTEAEEVTQEAWVVALERPPRHRANWRGWLTSVTRSIASNRRRSERRRVRHELNAAVPEDAGAADEAAEIHEICERLASTIDGLRESYRVIIHLRFRDGLAPRQIAERLDIPVETVRTRQKRAVAQLRNRLDEQHDGGRRLWSATAIRFSDGDGLTPRLSAGRWAASIVGSAAALVPVALVTLGLTDESSSLSPLTPAAIAESARVSRTPVVSVEGERTPLSISSERRDPPVGTIQCRLTWKDDGTPAKDVRVLLERVGVDGRHVETLQFESDDEGRGEFSAVPPGTWRVRPELGSPRSLALSAGQTSSLEIELERGITVEGRVRTHDGLAAPFFPVAASWPRDKTRFEEVATCDAEGRFRIERIDPDAWIGARGEGADSLLLWLASVIPGGSRVFGTTSVSVDLTLREPGPSLELWVADATGSPIEGARVEVTATSAFAPSFAPDGSLWMTPPSRVTRTDSDGAAHLRLMAAQRPGVRVCAYGFRTEEVVIQGGEVRRGRYRVELQAEDADPPELPLPTGKLLDAEGAALVGWSVAVVPERFPDRSSGTWFDVLGLEPSRGRWRVTDGTGCFSWCPERAQTYTVTATPGMAGSAAPAVWRGIAADGDSVVLSLAEQQLPGAFEGRVLGDGPLPVGAELLLWSPGLPDCERCPLDAGSGRFRTGRLAPGPYRIGLWLPGQAPRLDIAHGTIHPDETTPLGEIVLEPPGRIRVLFSRADGTDVIAPRLSITGPFLDASACMGTEPPLMEFESTRALLVRGLPAGDYSVRVAGRRAVPVQDIATVVSGAEVVLALEQPVHDESGALVNFYLPERAETCKLHVTLLGAGREVWRHSSVVSPARDRVQVWFPEPRLGDTLVAALQVGNVSYRALQNLYVGGQLARRVDLERAEGGLAAH